MELEQKFKFRTILAAYTFSDFLHARIRFDYSEIFCSFEYGIGCEEDARSVASTMIVLAAEEFIGRLAMRLVPIFAFRSLHLSDK